MSNKYYRFAFAEDGDKTSVPDTSSDTNVNYKSGYSDAYEKDPSKGTGGRFVERTCMNRILNDVTTNVKFYQENTFPEWIADNGQGTPFSYPKHSMVTVDKKKFINTADNNTSKPDTKDSLWIPIDFLSFCPAVSPIPFPSSDPDKIPDGYLPLNGLKIDEKVYPILHSFYGDYLPDLVGKFIKGAGTSAKSKDKVDALVEQEAVVGSHVHTGTTDGAGAHSHNAGTMNISSGLYMHGSTPNNPKLYRNTSGGMIIPDDPNYKFKGNYYLDPTKKSPDSGWILGSPYIAQPQDSYSGFRVEPKYNSDIKKSSWYGETSVANDHTHKFKTDEDKNKVKNMVDNISFMYIVRAC